MKMKIVSVLAAMFVVAGPAFALESGNTRVTYPSALSVEVLGRGMLGSVNFDEVVSDEFAAGFGLGVTGTQFVDSALESNRGITVLPIYANYYFMPQAGSLYLTAGADVVLNKGDTRSVTGLPLRASSPGSVPFARNGSAILPTFGLGYERRTDNGFLFRMAAYGIVGDSIKPWFGASFGLCF